MCIRDSAVRARILLQPDWRMRRLRQRLLFPRGPCISVPGERLGAVVPLPQPEKHVANPVQDRPPHPAIAIRQHHHAQPLLRHHPYFGEHSVVGPAVAHRESAPEIADHPPQPVHRKVALRASLHRRRSAHHIVRLPHLPLRRFAEDPPPVDRPSAQLQQQPARHVVDARDDAARRRHRVPVDPPDARHRAFKRRVRRRIVAQRRQVAHRGRRAPHPQRHEQPLSNKLVPAHPGLLRHHLARRQHHQVRVPVSVAERVLGFQVARPPQNLLAAV